MSLHNLGDEDAAVVKIPTFAEGAGLLDIRRRVHQVAAGLPVLHPKCGLVNALVLLPDAAQDFDEKAAAAARRVADGNPRELRHERFGAGEVGLARTDRIADLRDARAEQAGHEAGGHRPGDAGGRVKNALVLAVGGEKHLVGLAENVLVNQAVVEMDDATLKSLAPIVHAQHGFEQPRETFQIFRIKIEFGPDGTLEEFRVVVVFEEFLEVREELSDDAVRTFGGPAFLGVFPVVLQLAVAHKSVIFHRLGEDELIEKLDDEFVVLGLVLETDGFKGAKPILQIFEKGAIQVGAHFAIFGITDDIEQAAAGVGAFEEVGERDFFERHELLPDIAGAVKIGIAQIGQDEVFRVLEIFLNLATMTGGFQAVAFQQFRAEGVKQRLEFDDDGRFLLGVQFEIHKAAAQSDLRDDRRVEKNFRQRTEQSLGGGFRLGALFGAEPDKG